MEFVDGSTACADCSAPLTSDDPEPDAQPPVAGTNTDLVVLHGYPSQIHAAMVGEALTNAGIHWLIKSNEMFGSGTGLGTLAPTRVEVWVATEQLNAAKAVADATLDPV
jgi:hypothetical protein